MPGLAIVRFPPMSDPDPELRSRLQEAFPQAQPPVGFAEGVWRRLAMRAERHWYQELFPSWDRPVLLAAVLATVVAGAVAGHLAGRRSSMATSEARYLSSIDPAYQPR